MAIYAVSSEKTKKATEPEKYICDKILRKPCIYERDSFLSYKGLFSRRERRTGFRCRA